MIAHVSRLAHISESLAVLADYRALEAIAAVELVVAGAVTKQGIPEALAEFDEAKRLCDEALDEFRNITDENSLKETAEWVKNHWLSGE